ncbi:MAG: response regulator, partial [Nitrospirota bacterium]
TAESTEGEGTTFYIYLPASEKEASAETGEYNVLSGKGRILLMDDDEIVRDATGNMLIELGYEAVMAEDGMSAIELYREAKAAGKPYDMVILDMTIPGGMGGKETIRELLKLDPHVKAIVSSGYSDDPVMAEFEKYGFTAVIKKPYNIQDISALLHKIVG